MIELAQEVWFLNPKSKIVEKGEVVGEQITTTGYKLLSILAESKQTLQLEEAHIHATEEEANTHKDNVFPFMAEADVLIEATKKKIDELRVRVIGEPKYLELANKIVGDKNEK